MENFGSNALLHFGQFGDRTFGMFCSYIDMRGQAMGNGFLEMRYSIN